MRENVGKEQEYQALCELLGAEKSRRLYWPLIELLRGVHRGSFTGTAGLEIDAKQGGVTTVRLSRREVM